LSLIVHHVSFDEVRAMGEWNCGSYAESQEGLKHCFAIEMFSAFLWSYNSL